VASKNGVEMTALHDLLLQKQAELSADLGAGDLITHPGAKGDVAELDWLEALNDFLPARYQVAKAFVIDSKGNQSDEIDLVVYDRHFCPLLFKSGGRSFIAAESVYAVFEVKQSLSRQNVIYAMKKAASVRGLERTSGLITDFRGKQARKQLFPILAGIVATRSDWSSGLGTSLKAALAGEPKAGHLDMGCALGAGSFEVSYEDETPSLTVSEVDSALVFFYLRLLARLQSLGTVAAIDFDAYSENLRASGV
jgi:hypothetical protein